jgi:hypothetical protein
VRICGIDPGLKGALAFADVTETGFSRITVYDMPVSDLVDGRDQPDEDGILAIFDIEKPETAVLEHVGPRPRSGSASEWRFAMGFGALRGCLRAWFRAQGSGPGVHLVTSKVWKAPFSLSQDKALSLALARSVFPSLGNELKLKKHDGRAEALLLIEYYRRVLMPLGEEGIEVI